MCKSYLRIDIVRWLLQQVREDLPRDAVVQQQDECELQGHCRAQSPPDKIGLSARNSDATDVDVAAEAMDPSSSDTEEESTSITTADSSIKKAVSFGLIEVREYNSVVGDNPTVRFGPPMSIGWEFVQRKTCQWITMKKENFQEHRTFP
jgi:hypothetical protein